MKLISAFWLALATTVVASGASPVRTAVGFDTAESIPELPEFGVTATRPWSLVELPGCRILSLARPADTAGFAKLAARERAFLRELMPEVREPEDFVSSFVVLGGSIFAEMQAAQPESRIKFNFGKVGAGGDRDIEFFVEPTPSGKRGKAPAPYPRWAGLYEVGLRSNLVRRHRELPDWYLEGVRNCGIRLVTEDAALAPRIGVYYMLTTATCEALKAGETVPDSPTPKPESWSVERLLTTTRPDVSARDLSRSPMSDRRIHQDFCVLFFHWGLRGGGVAHRTAFRRWVAAAAEAPIDEARFRECFGFGFNEAQRQFLEFARHEIGAYTVQEQTGRRPPAAEGTETPPETEPSDAPASERPAKNWVQISPGRGSCDFLLTEEFELEARRQVASRPARREEILELLGEAYLWTALNIRDRVARDLEVSPLVRARGYRPILDVADAAYRVPSPEKLQQFVTKAGTSLRPLLDDAGPREADLSALLGIMELRVGNKSEALRLLQAAVTKGSRRPLARLDLARLLLDQAVRDAGKGEQPDRAQVAAARELLRDVLRRTPEIEPVPELLAYAWGCTGETPPRDELELLTRAALREPQECAMLQEIAILWERAGVPGEAARVAQAGLAWLSQRWRPPAGFLVEMNRLAALGSAADGATAAPR